MTGWLTEPAMAYCSFCPWEMACATESEATAKKEAHQHLRHNQPVPLRELAGSDWQSQALDAVRTVAARGAEFTLHEALREFGVGDPPNAKTALGRFAALVHDLRAAHPCGYRQSTRAGTKRSAVAVWSRDQGRCTNPECRVRVA